MVRSNRIGVPKGWDCANIGGETRNIEDFDFCKKCFVSLFRWLEAGKRTIHTFGKQPGMTVASAWF